jgi:O-antigen/teichoic acid export membrane protein
VTAGGCPDGADQPLPSARGSLGQLVSGTARYFVIGAASRAVQLASIPILLRMLTPGEFGVQAVALLNEQLLMIVAGYAFTNAITKHYSESRHDDGAAGRVVGTAVAGVLVAGGAAFVVWQAAAPVIARLALDDSSDALVVTRLVGVSAVANLVVTLVTTVWQLDQRFRPFAVATIGQYVLAAVLGVALVAAGAGPVGVVAGWTVASCLVALGAALLLRRELPLAADRDTARVLLAYGGPLVPAALLMLVLTTNDRYLLANLDGLRAVGVYAAILTVVNGLNTGLVGPFKRSLLPMMWRLRGDPGEVAFHRRAFTLYWVAQGWILLGLLGFGEPLLAAFGGDDAFSDSAGALAVVYGGFVLLNAYEFLSAGYFFEGRTVYYPITVAASTVVALLWNVGLVPVWGIWAAAWSNPVSYGVFALLSWRFGRRWFDVPYAWRQIGAAVLVVAGLGALVLLARAAWGPWAGGLSAVLAVGAYPAVLLGGKVLDATDRAAARSLLASVGRR